MCDCGSIHITKLEQCSSCSILSNDCLFFVSIQHLILSHSQRERLFAVNFVPRKQRSFFFYEVMVSKVSLFRYIKMCSTLLRYPWPLLHQNEFIIKSREIYYAWFQAQRKILFYKNLETCT